MIRVRQIKLPLNHSNEDLKNEICKRLSISSSFIKSFKINKKSIDARGDIYFVYEIDVDVDSNLEKSLLNNRDVIKTPNEKYEFKATGDSVLDNRPVIIGSGPAGLFCGYFLAKYGYKPIIIEKGEDIDKRVNTVERFWNDNALNVNSNVQFGEGGAGTFSDGKLNTTSKDIRIKEILRLFVLNGAPEEILYIKNPHIGTDNLRSVIKNIRKKIISLGGSFFFESKLEEIIVKNNRICKIKVNGKLLDTDILVLAIGHSSRDTFRMLLNKGIEIVSKPFAVGVRVQHRQNLIDKNQYGDAYKFLPRASYKLTYKSSSGRGVYSFCMCPGGFVVNSSSEREKLVINGMSNYKRDEENANSAIIVTVGPDDFGIDPLCGVRFQESLEENAYREGAGNIPVQLYKDLKSDKISEKFHDINPIFKGSYTMGNLNNIFPPYIISSLIEGIDYFDKKIPGFAADDVIISAVESRTSSPVRIIRDDNYESNINGIYPCGEGAGYAGGIMTSALDGIKVFEAICKKYKSFK